VHVVPNVKEASNTVTCFGVLGPHGVYIIHHSMPQVRCITMAVLLLLS
jgi:hypothetical protein